MTLSQELDKLVQMQQKVLAEVVNDFYSELIAVSPVGNPTLWKVNQGRGNRALSIPRGYRSGSLKGAWDLRKTATGWQISNNMTYASIIFDGRVPDEKGIIRGSKQLPFGIDPIIFKYNRILQIKLDNIRV